MLLCSESAACLAWVYKDYGVAGSFLQQHERGLAQKALPKYTNIRLCVNQVIYEFSLKHSHVEFSSSSFYRLHYVSFPFPIQPLNENNNFDHNKAAKIISRGSWLNIASIDKIQIFIITKCFTFFMMLSAHMWGVVYFKHKGL